MTKICPSARRRACRLRRSAPGDAPEVLSPGTARHDRFTKRHLYQAQGVPEYWIVDVNTRMVERWRPGDERAEFLADTLTWQPDPAVPPLTIDLPAYFAEVFGESPA